MSAHDIWLARALEVRPLTPDEKTTRKQLLARPNFDRRRRKVETELNALAQLAGAEPLCQAAREKLRLAVEQAGLGRFQTAFEMLEPIKHDIRTAIKNVKEGRDAALIEARKEIAAVKERLKAVQDPREREALSAQARAAIAGASGDVSSGKILEAAAILRGLATGKATPGPAVLPARQDVPQRLREIGLHYNKVRDNRRDGPEAVRLFNRVDELHRAGNTDEAHAALDALEKYVRQSLLRGERAAPRKVQEQANRFNTLRGTVGAVKKNYLADGMAASYAAEPLKAGKEFNLFLTQLRTFEKGRNLKNLELLTASAKLYLKHLETSYTGLSSWKKTTKESLRKKKICETTLQAAAHWRLALEFEELGEPPWDDVKESRAANLYANVLFEEGTASPRSAATARNPAAKLGKPLEPSGAEDAKPGVNALWVLDATSWGDRPDQVKQVHSFVFKPLDAEAESPGFPQGGSAAREVLGKAIGNQIEELIGLDLAVPETHLVTIDNDKLQKDNRPSLGGAPLTTPQQRVGSLQAWTRSDGSLGGLLEKTPDLLTKVPDEDCHKMGVLDLVSLNLDRHAGNFLVRKETVEGRETARLLPIDHGQILPSREGLSQNRTKIGHPFSVVAQMPGSDQPFSRDMLEKLEKLDPDEVAEGLSQSLASLARTHPEAARKSAIGEEQIRLVKRSTRFLKQAAEAGLTLGEIYDAYTEDLEKIFDSTDDVAEARFAEAIQGSRARSKARKEFATSFDLRDDRRFKEVSTQLSALGWVFGGQDVMAFCTRNPALVVEVCKNNRQNPAVLRELAAMKAALGDAAPAQGRQSLGLHYDTVKVAYENSRFQALKGPGAKITPADRQDVQDFLEADGPALLAANGRAGLTYPENLREFRRLRKLQLLAARDQEAVLAEFRKAFPEEPLKNAEQVERKLHDWLEYQRLGGNNEYFRLGGPLDLKLVRDRLEALRRLTKVQGGFRELPPLPPTQTPAPTPPSVGATPPPRTPPVVLPAATLELATWNEARRLALAEASPGKLHTDNYRPVERALTVLQRAKTATEAAGADAPVVEAYVNALRELRRVLAGYVPRTAAGDAHTGMANHARQLSVLLDQAISFREAMVRT